MQLSPASCYLLPLRFIQTHFAQRPFGKSRHFISVSRRAGVRIDSYKVKLNSTDNFSEEATLWRW
jgi:hypothetical protein